jgi:glycosyltransferase involved in cell wall biosynthesis
MSAAAPDALPGAVPDGPAGPPMRVGYLVSRFPAASETFVVREMNEVARDPAIELELLSLFPSRDDFLHPSAERWMAGLRRPQKRAALTATLRWLGRRPLRTTATFATVAAAGVRRPRMMLRSLATLVLAARHAESVRELGIDHLHAHFASYPALAAWACHRLCGVGYSFTAHAYDIFVDQTLLARKLADADFVATISEYNRRFLARYGGEVATPVHVVHCGVDPAAYDFVPRPIPASGRVRALVVASLQEKKGHAVLFEALARGGAGLERVDLELVGGGELREPLQARVAELGLESRVSFLGPLSEPEVRDRLGEADLFVLPSIIASDGQMEGLPVALIEALASGLTAVASRMSGIPELIDDGVTGYLAEPGDATDLAAALERAVAGPPVDFEAGRRLVAEQFDISETGRRMARLLLSAPRSPRG